MFELIPSTASIPAAYLVGSLFAAKGRHAGWKALRLTTGAAALLAVFNAATGIFHSGDAVGIIAAQLVTFLGWIIGAFSERYLNGEPGQRRFRIAYLLTLAGVTTVATSHHLGVIIAAWSASSIGLHNLLMFYPDRPAAIVVAHKKFLASRVAEVLLLIAAIVLYAEHGTLELATLSSQISTAPLTTGDQAAALLIAAAVVIKCAQLPLHGWLIQVMEAPTPVSALLHAGIVNLGGVVLIRLSSLMDQVLPARALLVVIGAATAAIAGMVMLTRVTIKVRLAWSTCSQMGLMVMECGLGLYDLALLHLVAHAMYKAHAFLTSGTVVQATAAGRTSKSWQQNRGIAASLCLAYAALVVLISAKLAGPLLGLSSPRTTALLILSMGLATLLWRIPRTVAGWIGGTAALVGASMLYIGLHVAFAHAAPAAPARPLIPLDVIAMATLAVLYFLQAWVLDAPRGRIPQALYEWAYAGLYLDEKFTRLTFQLWPPSPSSASSRGLKTQIQSSPRNAA